MPDANKWMETLKPTTPLREAAGEVLTHRFDAVETWLKRATDSGYDDPVKAIHQLRVSTRRAGSALAIFADAISDKALRKARKTLKQLRRAAGAARDCDVHHALFSAIDNATLNDEELAARDAVLAVLEAERDIASENLRDVANDVDATTVRSRRERVTKSLRKAAIPEEVTLADAASDALPCLIGEVRDCAESHNGEPAKLHQLRIACKQLRYATEVFAPCFGDDFASDLYPRLKDTQDHLGVINDAHLARLRLERILLDLTELDEQGETDDRDDSLTVERGLRSLIGRYAEQEERSRVEFLSWWESVHGGDFLAPFERLVPPPTPRLKAREGSALPAQTDSVETTSSVSDAEPAHTSNGVHRVIEEPMEPEMETAPPSRFGARRLAAIDVGTNSIRVIVAEAFADGQYRVLDDEKEIARIGTGMTETNRIDDASMERAVLAIDRQKRIAEGYGASYIRAVGTAAVRDAENGQALVDLVLERTGVRIEVISPEEEAQLTFKSVSAAFDLTSFPSVIADIGGGSAEVVLCSGGLIEQVFPVPLGAVRLTEMFGGPEASAGARFDEMNRFIREQLDDYFRDAAIDPELLIGAGGTFEALAKLSMGRFGPTPGALIRGYDMQRSEVKRLLERLRSLPPKERAKLPGISPNRAEIIVAGAALVLALMKRLTVDRLRVHDGGIRDGLLLTMVQEMFPQDNGSGAAEDPKDPMRSVRRFSQVCNYERRHCAHVSRLGLQLFDQLVRDHGLTFDKWETGRARVLFHAAALLHDIGYHIDYKKHHLHSYHLILHSALRGFSRREIEIVGQVARYHRKGLPKIKHKPFAKLSSEDRDLVRTLSAILRVADGLDRTHMRLVKSISLRVEGEHAHFDLLADSDPSVDVWGAERKADLWMKVFGLSPVFRWTNAPKQAPAEQPREPVAKG
jgi:exopolyphosphatase/guanosine-5'-triphosphate,3'-diphosphate pyrophosphatase